jgi:hypothetical protein
MYYETIITHPSRGEISDGVFWELEPAICHLMLSLFKQQIVLKTARGQAIMSVIQFAEYVGVLRSGGMLGIDDRKYVIIPRYDAVPLCLTYQDPRNPEFPSRIIDVQTRLVKSIIELWDSKHDSLIIGTALPSLQNLI